MIEFSFIPPTENPIERLLARLPVALAKALDKTLDDALDRAKVRMRPGGGGPQIRSGRLAASLGKQISLQGDTVTGELIAEAPYAAAQEYGAVIQARQGKYLKFQVQGRWVSVRQVILPARPYLRPAAEDALGELENHVYNALSEELS